MDGYPIPVADLLVDAAAGHKCWCKFGTEGEAPTPQYSPPPKGQRTKEPLRRTTPSSTTANSTTTATTKRKLEKTATTY
jgi:hypothetical protein